MTLYSYVVARDYGFAPNPFWGMCTLATCKPDIRQRAQIGDWIVGTGSASKLKQSNLVYAMEVNEVLTFNEYWNDPRFQLKKPNLGGARKYQYGDNIYHIKSGQWEQLESHHSFENGSPSLENIQTDTSVDRVLISNNFLYFGVCAPIIPNGLHSIIKSGPGYKNHFETAVIERFLIWIASFREKGYQARPIDWK